MKHVALPLSFATASLTISFTQSLEIKLRVILLTLSVLLALRQLLSKDRPPGTFFAILLAGSVLTGCASNQEQLARLDTNIQQATNVLGVLQEASKAAPEPAHSIADILFGISIAGLAGWQALNHRRLGELKLLPPPPPPPAK
jgi:hypothetical protein